MFSFNEWHDDQREEKLACSRLSVSGDERKSVRGTSFFLYHTPLVARRLVAF